ncbi:LytR/AlgR family response regulator transcription factor [Anaerosalibacter massiliensis]|uniref:LytTR family DNA-binding domain-containing protein n=1 Tax=Anaerosalibacter massiliensis TaxID=1347392 RepID=A0A9X2MJX5_9FIRM|nr:LytTR family DNA-binding domain-containing protein [Anaerosalibacter massiliensis]MCR2044888.1 LytTR family DNA-binding domain-containing protein [Anaerosalibacter massiliensis]
MLDIINVAICEDEKIHVELLEKYVANWAKERNMKVRIEVFYSAESFNFNWIMDKRYDILLLDIQMPGQNGIELAKTIRKKDNIINIIFITALSDYIGEGYNVEAINYLIKPIEEKKLYECLDRAVARVPKLEKIILIKDQGEIHRLVQDEIIYIESFGHDLEINTTNEKYITRKSLSIMEKELDEDIFIRCHRSYIAGLKHIKRISKNELELDNGDIIPISRRQYSKTNMAFIKYFRGVIDE